MNIFLLSIFLISIFLEGTVLTLPLVLIYLLCFTIIKRDAGVFVFAFVAGLILDLLTVHLLGSSSLFFVVFVFIILLYQRKYEINSYPFVAFASFFGAIGFIGVFGGGNIFLQALLSSFVASILFMILRIRSLPQRFSI